MRSVFFSRPRVLRGVFSSLFALTGAAVLAGCGGGSGGPSGGSGGGGGGGVTLGADTIVFVSNRDGNNEIYRSTNTGASQTRITSNAGSDTNPFLARNRQFIVFTSNRDGNNEIYRFNVSDSTLQRFTSDATDVSDDFAVVSADSSRIAWVSERGGTNNIWIMDSTGANQTQVTTNGGTSPAFSPDGTQIAYLNPGRDIVVRTLSTGNERVIDTNLSSPATISDLTWSPNGTTLAFTQQLSAGVASNILLIPSTATNTTGAVTFSPVTGSKSSLTWGPTAAQQPFVFSAIPTGTATPNLFSAVGTNATAANQITTTGSNFAVSWTN